MRNNWISYLIIVIVLLIIVTIGFLIFNVLKPSDESAQNNAQTETTTGPELVLNKEVNEDKVTITLEASMPDGSNNSI